MFLRLRSLPFPMQKLLDERRHTNIESDSTLSIIQNKPNGNRIVKLIECSAENQLYSTLVQRFPIPANAVVAFVREFTIRCNEVTMAPSKTHVFVLIFAFCSSLYGHAIAQDSATNQTQEQTQAVRVALDGDCCVSLIEMHAYVKGEQAFSSHWRGLRYLFLSEEEKVVFDSNPEKYSVAFGGLDVVATYGLEGPVVGVKKVYGLGRNTHRFEDQTYHFASEENFRRFTKNPEEYVSRARQAAYQQAEAKRGKTLAELYPNK